MPKSATLVRPAPLTEEQTAFFHREGYLIVPDVFDPEDLTPLRRQMEEQVDAKARELHAAGALVQLHEELDFDRRLVKIYQESKENGEIIMRHLEGRSGGGFHGEEMFKIIKHPKLLAKVESLLGSEEIIAASVFRLRPKLPNIGRGVVPWHQDSGYMQEHCDRHLAITCWVPLVDATVENGCMQILPRVQNQGIYRHHTGGNANFLVILDQNLPKSPAEAITAACPRGGVVFMTNLTPHCSTPNSSDHIRWSVDLRYQAAGTPNNHGLWPAKDDDHDDDESDYAKNVNIACYPAEADFLIQSRKNPEFEVTYADFVKRRVHFENANLPFPPQRWQAVLK